MFELLILTLCALPGGPVLTTGKWKKGSGPILLPLKIDGSSVCFLLEQACL